MSSKALLKAQTRQESGSGAARRLRSAGMVPGVIYGSSREPLMLQINKQELAQILRHHASDHLLVDVEIDGQPVVNAVVKDIQRHPYRPMFIHVDLHEVSMTEILRASVSIEPRGVPIGVTQSGGVLEQPLFELDIECQAQALPEILTFDVSGMDIGDTISVADFAAPEGVRVLTDPEIAIFHVVAPRKSAEVEEAEATGGEEAAGSSGN